jgi:Domain of unknown function (DUF4349)/Putative zinc-finger
MSRTTHPVSPEELMAYLDGELPVTRARECAGHLEQCPDCQLLAADLRSLGQQMNAWQADPAPETLSRAMRSAIDHHQPATTTRWRSAWQVVAKPRAPGRAWALAGFAGALVMISVVGFLRPGLVRLSEPVLRRATETAPPMTQSESAQTAVPGDSLEQKQAAAQEFLEQNLSTASTNSAMADQAARRRELDSMSSSLERQPPDLRSSPATGPMIARTASLTLVVKDLERSRVALDAILHRHGAYAAQLESEAPEDQGRTLTATLRVPANQLDAVLAEVKALGRVERESQGGEEVTAQYVDLNARLSNARNTEQRLIEVLNQRTGKMADILAVENEIARVRGEIEQMEGERQGLEHRVSYSELQVELKEEYKAALEVTPPSEAAQLRNSLVGGLRLAAGSLLGFVAIVAGCGPALILWGFILFWPARWLWRRRRHGAPGVV